MRYLDLHDAAFFYLAVPLMAKPTATTLIRELGCDYETVRPHIMTFETG